MAYAASSQRMSRFASKPEPMLSRGDLAVAARTFPPPPVTIAFPEEKR
jgi:hypothetical protein